MVRYIATLMAVPESAAGESAQGLGRHGGSFQGQDHELRTGPASPTTAERFGSAG